MNSNEDLTIKVSAKKIYDSLKRLEMKSDEMIAHQKKTNGRVTELENSNIEQGKKLDLLEEHANANTNAVKDIPMMKMKILVIWGVAVMLAGVLVKYITDLILPRI